MRIQNLKKKLCCLAASAVLCMTSTNLSAFAENKTDPLPSWVPQTFEQAQEFSEKNGITHADDGVICFVRPEQAGAIDLFYSLTESGPNDVLNCKCLYNNRFEVKGSQIAYEVWVYLPYAKTLNFRMEAGGGITGAVTESTDYSFKIDKKGNITETDIYGWAPDCNSEYREFIKNNPNLSLHDNYLVYWDSVCYDGGYTLEMTQEGEGSFTKIVDDNFYQTHNQPGEVPAPGDWGGDILQVYKPDETGSVTVTFTNAQQPPNFSKVSEDAKITEKKYTILYDGRVKEKGIFDLPDWIDWIPTDFIDYLYYMEHNPQVVLRDNLVVYWGKESDSHCNVDKISGDGEFEMTKINCSPPLSAGAGGGEDFYVKVYKPKKAGKVVMSWTYGNNGMSETADFINIDNSIDRSYIIDKDMNVTETFDWVPKSVEEYEQYLKRHEPISLNGDYIVYSSRRDPSSQLGEGYDNKLVKKLADKQFSLDIDDAPTYRFIVYGNTDLIRTDNTVDMSWWSEHGDVRLEYKTKSFTYADNGFITVKLEGDFDNDGTVNPNDVSGMGKYLVKKNNIQCFKNSDINNDGKLNVIDLLMLKRQVVKDNTVVEQSVSPDATTELTADLKPYTVASKSPDKKYSASQAGFALDLLKKTFLKDENTLVSPYSVVQALSMTTNGADNNTLKEMLGVIGSGLTLDELNSYNAAFRLSQPNDEKCRLLTANSIWCTSDKRFTVNKDFLLKNKSFYDAQIFSTPFDASSVTAVNDWVKKHTDNMIPKIVEEFTGDEVMALINAVTFDAKWALPYEDSYENSSFFKAVNGKTQKASILSETGNMPYLEDKEAKGFMKYYEGGRYAFAAILPNEGVSIDKYVSGLTANKLSSLLSTAKKADVHSVMPKFKTDYSSSLLQTLEAMGIKEAFDAGAADFSKLGKSTGGNIYISDVIHKTHIDVDEEGTKAAAATAVIMKDNAVPMYEDLKEVILNRPFLYAIIDTQTNIPIFIGTQLTLE